MQWFHLNALNEDELSEQKVKVVHCNSLNSDVQSDSLSPSSSFSSMSSFSSSYSSSSSFSFFSPSSSLSPSSPSYASTSRSDDYLLSATELRAFVSQSDSCSSFASVSLSPAECNTNAFVPNRDATDQPTDRPTDLQTDKADCRVTCSRLKNLSCVNYNQPFPMHGWES